jgi:hypothetical protein
MTPGGDSVERIRRHEVSRALKKVNISPKEEEVIVLFSRSLVGKLFQGPISEVMERAKAEILLAGRPVPETPCGREKHGGEAGSPESKTNCQLREDGKLYFKSKFDIGSD